MLYGGGEKMPYNYIKTNKLQTKFKVLFTTIVKFFTTIVKPFFAF